MKIREGKIKLLSNQVSGKETISSGKEEKKQGNSIFGRTHLKRVVTNSKMTIRFKLAASYLVPIAFIILLGVVSYRVASDAIVKNYEKSALQTISMTGKYLRFGLSSVEATSVQYGNDKTINRFFCNLYANDKAEYNAEYKYIGSIFSAKQTSDEFVDNIYILSDMVKSISTKASIDSGLYGGFTQTKLGAYLKDNRMKKTWIGKDEYLDEKLKTSSKDYSIRLVRSLPEAKAMMIIDVSTDTVNNILAGLDFDKSDNVALVTSDGREIKAVAGKKSQEVKESSEKAIFTSQEFYKKAIASKATEDTQYVNYEGKTYLFLYSKIGETGAAVCALIPKNVITSQADNIRKITIVIVIIAIILAAVIAILISQGIDQTIKAIIGRLKEASRGDLTVQFHSRRRDEFHVLIEEIQNTFTNMKKLIYQVNSMSNEVSASSENVSATSEVFLKSTKDISSAMNEIEQGISQQAKDAQECLVQMDNLSNKIILVSDNTKEIGQIADQTKQSIHEGTAVTGNLNNQTQSTIEITTDVIHDIEALEQKSLSISKIISVIHEIANQTNLLSLNASIEAARAGEYGKGFAVVASEIRKLAEQSQGSVNEINHIIESIQNDTRKAAQTARKAEDVLKLQGDAVNDTTASYKNINDNVERLMVYLNSITRNVGTIEEAKQSALGAIENISAVLEEIAASANTVNQTSNEQQISVETLNAAAEQLSHNAETLVLEVKKFRVN
jgi:Methyl-accepting chemotaxis protein